MAQTTELQTADGHLISFQYFRNSIDQIQIDY